MDSGSRCRFGAGDGGGGTLTTGPGPGLSANLSKDVWKIQVCELKPGWGYACSDWKT
ncbi:hypothetical protein [Streptosporangium sp. NPDC020145]|uniref:hypothetical protein n=1 Tax=Streptosporangium sp. NPDC020145 TaxID=3154694 RepID=UPI00343C2889